MSELTERLHTNCPDECGECIECAQLKVDAADEIERQSAEITRLHYESGVLFEKWDLAKKVADLRLKTIKGLEDKLAAAEAALREAKCCVYNMTPTRTVDDQFDTLDEQLGFLLPQIKQLQTKLAAAERDVINLRGIANELRLIAETTNNRESFLLQAMATRIEEVCCE